MITELRKELRVSDDDHRVLLSRVNNDDMIKRIRFENTASFESYVFYNLFGLRDLEGRVEVI